MAEIQTSHLAFQMKLAGVDIDDVVELAAGIRPWPTIRLFLLLAPKSGPDPNFEKWAETDSLVNGVRHACIFRSDGVS